MSPPLAGIYRITNTINGMHYVGGASDLSVRFRTHKGMLKKGCHFNKKLQNDWDKYGSGSFTFNVIEIIDEVEKLIDREQHWMKTLNVIERGFNLSKKSAGMIGMRHSLATKEKISTSSKGTKLSEETKAKISAAHMGKALSPEGKAKLLAANLGRKASEETRKRMSIARSNVSAETRLKISIAGKGRKKSKEAIEKTASAHRGMKRSAETKAKISAARRAAVFKKKSMASIATIQTPRSWSDC